MHVLLILRERRNPATFLAGDPLRRVAESAPLDDVRTFNPPAPPLPPNSLLVFDTFLSFDAGVVVNRLIVLLLSMEKFFER